MNSHSISPEQPVKMDKIGYRRLIGSDQRIPTISYSWPTDSDNLNRLFTTVRIPFSPRMITIEKIPIISRIFLGFTLVIVILIVHFSVASLHYNNDDSTRRILREDKFKITACSTHAQDRHRFFSLLVSPSLWGPRRSPRRQDVRYAISSHRQLSSI